MCHNRPEEGVQPWVKPTEGDPEQGLGEKMLTVSQRVVVIVQAQIHSPKAAQAQTSPWLMEDSPRPADKRKKVTV